MGDPHPPPNLPKPPDLAFKPPDPRRKSYASVLNNQDTSFGDGNTHEKVLDKSFFDGPAMEKMGQIGFYQARRTIRFSDEEIDAISSPFRFTLIGKFSHGYPSMQTLRLKMAGLGLKGDFTIGVLNVKHILIRLKLEEDYTRIWMRQIIFIDGFPMRVFKWTPTFDPKEESPLVPVWIRFPNLPVQFFNKAALFNIASMIGTPLRIDESTAKLTRPSIARVCVEVDLTKPLEHEITIGFYSIFRVQRIEYERLPKYCNRCKHLGHGEKECYDGQMHGNGKGAEKVTQSSNEEIIGLERISNTNVNVKLAVAPPVDLRRLLNKQRGLEVHEEAVHAGTHKSATAAGEAHDGENAAAAEPAAGAALVPPAHADAHGPQDLVRGPPPKAAHAAENNKQNDAHANPNDSVYVRTAHADVRVVQEQAHAAEQADVPHVLDAHVAQAILAPGHTVHAAVHDSPAMPHAAVSMPSGLANTHAEVQVAHADHAVHVSFVPGPSSTSVGLSPTSGHANVPMLTGQHVVHVDTTHAARANADFGPCFSQVEQGPTSANESNEKSPIHDEQEDSIPSPKTGPHCTSDPATRPLHATGTNIGLSTLMPRSSSFSIEKQVNIDVDDALVSPLNTQAQDFNNSSSLEAANSSQNGVRKVFDEMSEPKKLTAMTSTLVQQISSTSNGKYVNDESNDKLECPLNSQVQDFNYSSSSEAENSTQNSARKVFDKMPQPTYTPSQLFDEMPQPKSLTRQLPDGSLQLNTHPNGQPSTHIAWPHRVPVVHPSGTPVVHPSGTPVVLTSPVPLPVVPALPVPLPVMPDRFNFEDSIEDIRALALHRCHSSDELEIPKPTAPRRSKRLALKRFEISYSSDSEYYEEEEFDRLFGHEYEQDFEDDFTVN